MTETVPESGTVWFSKIRTVFGGTNPVRIRDFYLDAASGHTVGNTGIPINGTFFPVSVLRGKAKAKPAVRFPPAALTGNSTTVSGQAYGNGTYAVTSTSSQYTNGPYMAFDRYNDTGNWNCMWHTADNSFNDATGVPNFGAQTVTISGAPVVGHWIKLAMPVGVVVKKYSVMPRQDGAGSYVAVRSPTSWVLAGSPDNNTWKQIDAQTNLTWTAGTIAAKDFTTSANTSGYSYLMFMVTRNGNADQTASRGATNVCELSFYGTEVPPAPTAPTSVDMGTASISNNNYAIALSTYFFGTSPKFSITSNPYDSAVITESTLYIQGDNRNLSYTVTVVATNALGSATSSVYVTESLPTTTSAAWIEEVNGSGSARSAQYFYIYIGNFNNISSWAAGTKFRVTAPYVSTWTTVASINKPRSGNAQQYQVNFSPAIDMQPYKNTTFEYM